MNSGSIDDKSLIQQLKAGDESAYKQIYIVYHRSLYGLAVKWLKDPDLAKDVVQNVFLRLWDYREKLDTDRSKSLKPLLTTFLKNQVLNNIRNREKRILKQVEFSWQQKESTNNTEEAVIYSDYIRMMENGLKQLSYRQEQIHRLKTKEGMTNKEVATKLNISIRAVKSQYYLANRFLREYMQKNADLVSKA